MKTWKPLLNTFLISEAHGSAWHMGLEKKYRLHIPKAFEFRNYLSDIYNNNRT